MLKLIAVLVLGFISSQVLASSTKIGRANATVGTLANATEKLISDIGFTPAQVDWPNILIHQPDSYPDWDGPYLRDTTADPWGNSYRLKIIESELVGVYSYGVNGIDDRGGKDDVTSWSGYDENIYHQNQFRNKIIALSIFSTAIILLLSFFLRSARKNKH